MFRGAQSAKRILVLMIYAITSFKLVWIVDCMSSDHYRIPFGTDLFLVGGSKQLVRNVEHDYLGSPPIVNRAELLLELLSTINIGYWQCLASICPNVSFSP